MIMIHPIGYYHGTSRSIRRTYPFFNGMCCGSLNSALVLPIRPARWRWHRILYAVAFILVAFVIISIISWNPSKAICAWIQRQKWMWIGHLTKFNASIKNCAKPLMCMKRFMSRFLIPHTCISGGLKFRGVSLERWTVSFKNFWVHRLALTTENRLPDRFGTDAPNFVL